MGSRVVWSVTAVVLTCACSTTGLRHLSGEPFARVGPVVRIGSGWVAVDSCTAGIHALVEVEVPEANRGHVIDLLHDLRLALDSGEIHRPSRVELAGPFCWPGDADGTRGGAPTPDGHRQGSPAAAPPCPGVFLVQAQFELRRIPPDGSPFLLVHGGKQTQVSWVRRSPPPPFAP